MLSAAFPFGFLSILIIKKTSVSPDHFTDPFDSKVLQLSNYSVSSLLRQTGSRQSLPVPSAALLRQRHRPNILWQSMARAAQRPAILYSGPVYVPNKAANPDSLRWRQLLSDTSRRNPFCFLPSYRIRRHAYPHR